MKTKCAVYEYYTNGGPIGYCNLDLSDLDHLTISYSTYRRLCRLCSDDVSFYIVAPIDRDCFCIVNGSDSFGYPCIRVFPNVVR